MAVRFGKENIHGGTCSANSLQELLTSRLNHGWFTPDPRQRFDLVVLPKLVKNIRSPVLDTFGDGEPGAEQGFLKGDVALANCRKG